MPALIPITEDIGAREEKCTICGKIIGAVDFIVRAGLPLLNTAGFTPSSLGISIDYVHLDCEPDIKQHVDELRIKKPKMGDLRRFRANGDKAMKYALAVEVKLIEVEEAPVGPMLHQPAPRFYGQNAGFDFRKATEISVPNFAALAAIIGRFDELVTDIEHEKLQV